MIAKLVHAGIDPRRIDDAAGAVVDELVPAFLSHPGACSGYWMVERASGHVLVMTGWSDETALHSEQAADGMERATIAEHVGLHIHAVQNLEIVAMHEIGSTAGAETHWVRVTWVEGVPEQMVDDLAELHDEKVSHQLRSGGLRASYWLADRGTGDGVAFSMWETAEDLAASEQDSHRRRRRFRRDLGCRIAMVATYEAIGVVLAPSATLVRVGGTDTPPGPTRTGPVEGPPIHAAIRRAS